MTYEQVKNATLKLLNQYTVAGHEVGSSYNNQIDYLKRIPDLVNDAVMEIATTVRKIPALLDLAALDKEDLGHEVRFTLPADFYQFVGGGFAKTTEGRLLHTNVYATQGRRFLILPKDEANDYSITYYRYPALISEEPAGDEEIDNDPDTHFAIPYYVAAHLAIHDESFLYSSFYNKYEDKLAKLAGVVHTEAHTVGDAYNFFS